MYHSFPSERPSLPYNLTSSSGNTDDPTQQSQAKFYPGNIQNNGTEVGLIAPGSYSYPIYQSGSWDESECSSIQQSIPSTPSDQSHFYPQPHLTSNDPSHAHDRVLDSFEEYPIGDDTHYLDPMQAHRAAGWGNPRFWPVQEGTVGRLEAQESSGSNLSGLSSTMINNSSSLPSDVGPYLEYVQGDYPGATSSSRGQPQADAVQSHVVTQGQDIAQQEACRRRERARERKKERDRLRKAADRAGDDEAFPRVCTLLAVKLDPRNTLSHRILRSVESLDQEFERMCELLEISMTPRETLAHRVLEGVEAMTERQKLDSNLRRELEESEAEMAVMKLKCATQHSNREDIRPSLPINPHTTLGTPCPNCGKD